MKRIVLQFSFLSLIALIFFSTVYCNSGEKHTGEELTYLNHSDTVRYVGMQVCRNCHYNHYQTFIHTGMGQSFDRASKQKTSAKFSSHDAVYDKHLNFYYKPFWSEDKFFIMEYRLNGSDTIHKRIEEVSYIIGSGQHTNSHLMDVNGYLYQMPLTFYTQEGRWDLPPGFENGNNSRFSRRIELECMSCHNSYPTLVEGSTNKYVSIPQGIDCERCHGPGSLHVQEKTAGKLVDTSRYIDYTIVNPKKLPYDLQVDVCQRCHLQGNAVLKEGKTFFDFKPGMKLSDYVNVFTPRYEGNEDEFIMASHADRLKQSKCFIESNRRGIRANTKKYDNAKLPNTTASLTCITCHNPHLSVRHTGADQFNNVCKSCHRVHDVKEGLLPECTEALSARKLKQDNCVSCHMPQSGTVDIPHVTVHDHKIRIPVSVAKKSAIKKFVSLVAINNPTPSAETIGEAYLNQFEKFEPQPFYLDSAAAYFERSSGKETGKRFQNLIRLYYLKRDYDHLILFASKQKPEDIHDGWTAYRIGEALNSKGDTERAYRYFKKSVALSPYIPEFQNKLGTVAAILDKRDEAKSVFEFIVRENPKFAPALSNLGYIYLAEGRAIEAEKWYDQAIALDPDYEQALLNKAGLHLYKNEKLKAKEMLNRVLKKNPDNAQAKELLQRLN